MTKTRMTLCPCGGAAYATCCEPFITQRAVPQTAQELMRSRYTAFTLRDDAYLSATWHRSTRQAAASITDGETKWLGLEVRNHTESGDSATVEFVARYKVDGRAHRLHEVSQFVREKISDTDVMRWFYVDGSFPENKK